MNSKDNFYLSSKKTDDSIELPVIKSTAGQNVIDIAKVPENWMFYFRCRLWRNGFL